MSRVRIEAACGAGEAEGEQEPENREDGSLEGSQTGGLRIGLPGEVPATRPAPDLDHSQPAQEQEERNASEMQSKCHS